MKKIIALLLFVFILTNANAQDIVKDTFDSNAFEWTECAFESNNGTAIIDKGVLTITSKGLSKGMSLLMKADGQDTKQFNTFFETHCYAPIDVMKPFKIVSRVTIDNLSNERIVGLVFNYKDGGNFYCFTFNNEAVQFKRFENNELVGCITQSIKWEKKSKLDQEWELISEDQILSFIVEGVPVLKVRYMPLQYSGFGFYTYGKQKLIVDEIDFIQL